MTNSSLEDLLAHYGVNQTAGQPVSNPDLAQLAAKNNISTLQLAPSQLNTLANSGNVANLINPNNTNQLNQLANSKPNLKTNVPYSKPYTPITPITQTFTQQQVQSIDPYDFGAVNAPVTNNGVTTYGVNKLTGADIVKLVNDSSTANATNSNSILNQLKSTGLTNQQLADLAGMKIDTFNTNMTNLNKLGSQTYGPNKLTAADITKILADPSALIFSGKNYVTSMQATDNAVKTLQGLGLTDQQIADLTGQNVSLINRYTQAYGGGKTAAQIYNFATGSQNWTNAYDLINRQDIINSYNLTAKQFADIMGISEASAKQYLDGVNASGNSARKALSSYH